MTIKFFASTNISLSFIDFSIFPNFLMPMVQDMIKFFYIKKLVIGINNIIVLIYIKKLY